MLTKHSRTSPHTNISFGVYLHKLYNTNHYYTISINYMHWYWFDKHKRWSQLHNGVVMATFREKYNIPFLRFVNIEEIFGKDFFLLLNFVKFNHKRVSTFFDSSTLCRLILIPGLSQVNSFKWFSCSCVLLYVLQILCTYSYSTHLYLYYIYVCNIAPIY